MKGQVKIKKAVNPNEIINTLYSYCLLVCAIQSPYSKWVNFISLRCYCSFCMQHRGLRSLDREKIPKEKNRFVNAYF